jgi:hypothetical protein
MLRDQIFIGYSHKDQKWARELTTFLRPLVAESRIQLWDETRFFYGDEGKKELREALASAKVAVLLLSADLLASHLMCDAETASLFDEATREGTHITWVVVRACAYTASPLMYYQAAFDPHKPLSALKPVSRNAALVQIAERIVSLLNGGDKDAGAGLYSDAAGGAHTFVCYAREDAEFVLSLASDLKAGGPTFGSTSGTFQAAPTGIMRSTRPSTAVNIF